MSVIRFSKEEMERLGGMLLYKFNYGGTYDPVKGTIQRSDVFKDKLVFFGRFEKKNINELTEKVASEVLGRLVWYCWVANKTAFALQYQEEPGLFDEGYLGIEKTVSCDLRKLVRELDHLLYNMFTGDGHIFLSSEWLELLRDIITAAKSAILSDMEDRAQCN